MEKDTPLQPFLQHLATERQICTDLLGNVMARKNMKTSRTAILNFWKNHLQKHIAAEEKVLIPFLEQHHFDKQYTSLLHREHETMQVLAERLSNLEEGDYVFEVFVKLVHQHLLFEDKVVFARMAETIPASELAQLRLAA